MQSLICIQVCVFNETGHNEYTYFNKDLLKISGWKQTSYTKIEGCRLTSRSAVSKASVS